MKKYLLKVTALVLLVGAMVGCSEDKVFYNESQHETLGYFVQPTGLLGLTQTVTQRVIQVQVSNKSSVARTIKISIDKDNTTALDSQYTIDQSTLVIPANSYTGNIKVSSNYYQDSLNNQDLKDPDTGVIDPTLAPQLVVTMALESIDGTFIDPKKNKFQLTIFNTCDLHLDQVGTNFTAVATQNAFADQDAVTQDPYQPTVTQTKSNEFTFDTLWGTEFVSTFTKDPTLSGKYVAPGKIVINDDLSLTIIPTENYQGAPYILTTSSGVYDTCKKTFKYTLVQNLFGPNAAFTVTVVVTPN